MTRAKTAVKPRSKKPSNLTDMGLEVAKVYISWSGDQVDDRVALATQQEDVTEIKRYQLSFEKANDFLKSWVITIGGDIIAMNADKGQIAVYADYLVELPKQVAKYADAIGDTVSFGLGLKMAEASKALETARELGGDRILFYTPEMDQEESPDPDAGLFEKIAQLQKSDHPLKGQFDSFIDNEENQRFQQELEAKESADTVKTKAAVVTLLQQVRSHSKELEGLKTEAPHLFESIMQMTQGLIMLTQKLRSEPDKLVKADVKHWVMHYPVNFLLSPGAGSDRAGRIKVATSNGKTVWRSVRAGMVMSPDGSPTSSRNPSGSEGGQ